MPECTAYLLDWFYQLHSCRTSGMALNPISYTEIEAWSRLTGNRPAPWEVATIKALDTAYLITINEELKGKEATK